eukprot:363622-Chlamydomonas_euryale.AAC.8
MGRGCTPPCFCDVRDGARMHPVMLLRCPRWGADAPRHAFATSAMGRGRTPPCFCDGGHMHLIIFRNNARMHAIILLRQRTDARHHTLTVTITHGSPN